MTYEEELKYKLSRVQDAVNRIGHIDFEVEKIIGADHTNFYRNKAQYPVYIENGNLIAGFYAYKSHRIIPCSDCRLQPPEFEQGIKAFEKWVKKNNITSFDEKTKAYISAPPHTSYHERNSRRISEKQSNQAQFCLLTAQ